MEVGRLVVGDERCCGGMSSGEGITSGAGVVGGIAVVGAGGAGAVGCVAVRDGVERGGRPQPRPAPGEGTVARALSDDPRRGLAVRGYADRGAHAGIATAASGTAGTDLVGTPLRVRLDSGVAAAPRPAIHRRPRTARRSTLVGADELERFQELPPWSPSTGHRWRSPQRQLGTDRGRAPTEVAPAAPRDPLDVRRMENRPYRRSDVRLRRPGRRRTCQAIRSADRMGRAATHRAPRDHHSAGDRGLRADARGPQVAKCRRATANRRLGRLTSCSLCPTIRT